MGKRDCKDKPFLTGATNHANEMIMNNRNHRNMINSREDKTEP